MSKRQKYQKSNLAGNNRQARRHRKEQEIIVDNKADGRAQFFQRVVYRSQGVKV